MSGYVTRDGRTIDAVEDATELVGNTPLVALESAPNLFAKLESHNPYSVKDRIAREMVDRAEATGRLSPDRTLVEATSGNTGIGVAFVAAVRGYDCVLVVPSSASRERRQLARWVRTSKSWTGACRPPASEPPRSSPPTRVPSGSDSSRTRRIRRTTALEIWAAMEAALRVAEDHPEELTVVVLPDSGERYLSTELFESEETAPTN